VKAEGPGRGGPIPLGFSESSDNQLPPGGVHGLAIRRAARLHLRLDANDPGRQVLYSDLWTLAKDDRPLDDISQLAHVAGPLVSKKLCLSFIGNLCNAPLGFKGKRRKKYPAKAGISSLLSLKGGMAIGITFSR